MDHRRDRRAVPARRRRKDHQGALSDATQRALSDIEIEQRPLRHFRFALAAAGRRPTTVRWYADILDAFEEGKWANPPALDTPTESFPDWSKDVTTGIIPDDAETSI